MATKITSPAAAVGKNDVKNAARNGGARVVVKVGRAAANVGAVRVVPGEAVPAAAIASGGKGVVVKEADDLMSASRYGLMMLRHAKVKMPVYSVPRHRGDWMS